MASSTDFTYTGDPANSSRDAVRFLIGDTDSAKKIFTDGEIDWTLSEEANVYLAAATASKAAAAHFATLVSMAVGDLRYSYGDRQKHYLDLAIKLETRGKEKSGGLYVGGISRSDKTGEEEDTDRVAPFATIGMDDHPGAKQRKETLRDDA